MQTGKNVVIFFVLSIVVASFLIFGYLSSTSSSSSSTSLSSSSEVSIPKPDKSTIHHQQQNTEDLIVEQVAGGKTADSASTRPNSNKALTPHHHSSSKSHYQSISSAVIPAFPFYQPNSFELSIFPNLAERVNTASQATFAAASLKLKTQVFETSYQKIDCGAIISDFCLWGGQPRYFRKGSKFFSSTGATRCCNEAETKFRFHSVMAEPFTFTQTSNNNFPAPYFPDTIVVAPMCWEQYGYHLFICLLNTWSVMSQLRFDQQNQHSTTTGRKLVVKIALLKSWSGHLIGNSADWWKTTKDGNDDDNHHQDKKKISSKNNNKRSPFWAWWSVIADHPSDVMDLNSFPSMCVPYGIVAGKLEIITPGMQQSFRRTVLKKLKITGGENGDIDTTSNRRKNNVVIKITVVDREKTFKLLNSKELAQKFKKAFLDHHHQSEEIIAAGLEYKVDSQVVVFENLHLRDQMKIAAETDIMIGMHGNGLTWSAFMEPQSALVELWPSFAYNGNYAHFAGRGNIKRWSVLGRESCPKRCNAAIDVQDSIVSEVVKFIVGTKIKKTIDYKGDEEYLKAQAVYAMEKKKKKKK